MKKVTAVLTSALILVTGVMAFVGCDKDGEPDIYNEKRVMNLSCNPSVEFVLSADDKVVSVNALNEEGNLVISGEVFVNLTAEEAAKLFVETSKDMGFIVEATKKGEVTIAENEISISFSGEKATALYNGVKGEIDEYLTTQNISATVTQAAAITEEQLEAIVLACQPHKTAAEVQVLERMELVEAIYQSRKETADLYSQELKAAYYEAKAFALEQAELKAVTSQLNVIAQGIVNGLNAEYVKAIEALENVRRTALIDETSPYQKALKNFQEAKINYLKYREQVAAMALDEFTAQVQTSLQNLDKIVNDMEKALTDVGALAHEQVNSAKAAVTTAYNLVIAGIGDYSAKVNSSLQQISTEQTAAITAFTTDFEETYASAITAARTNWADMKAQLETKTAPQA